MISVFTIIVLALNKNDFTENTRIILTLSLPCHAFYSHARSIYKWQVGYGYGDKDEKVISIQLQNKFLSQHIRPIKMQFRREKEEEAAAEE